MRGRSYSPSPPPRGYGRRGRSPSPRGRYGGHSRDRDMPTSLLVRNLRHDCRPDDLRRPFGQFGPVKDIYLPKDYYSGQPRGFGFVQFVDPADAAEAKYQMDGHVLLGREVTVVFAEENRKKPSDMRQREGPSSRGSGRYRDRRGSPPRYSRSPPRRLARSRPRSRSFESPPPKGREYSRSVSPPGRRYSRERSFSRSPPPYNGSRGRSQSPVRGPSRSRSRSPRRIGRSSSLRPQSPNHEDYSREPNGDRSLSP
ncbi:serine/arginine-rich SC35-like splicing factor SCL30A [Argentina anserina]|uniref:serine/arginine-rich SC35-like splicing factor SCL30A n=1 Tax=Argentina anserina TaxID=57926 RepID=UPI0021766670|nr:serine/arginine-rich SC35-like splicing factor SCL30A [Potentilla anserina]